MFPPAYEYLPLFCAGPIRSRVPGLANDASGLLARSLPGPTYRGRSRAGPVVIPLGVIVESEDAAFSLETPLLDQIHDHLIGENGWVGVVCGVDQWQAIFDHEFRVRELRLKDEAISLAFQGQLGPGREVQRVAEFLWNDDPARFVNFYDGRHHGTQGTI